VNRKQLTTSDASFWIIAEILSARRKSQEQIQESQGAGFVEPPSYSSREEPATADRVPVQRAHAGDQHAFEALIRWYKPALFGLI
jgi:hypothetical protein